MTESDFVGKSSAIHIRHVKEIDPAFVMGQDEPILLIDFRRIAAVLVPGLQRDVAVKAIFVQYVGEALAAFLVY